MPDKAHIPHLLKLLDDDSVETRQALSSQFKKFGGDISDDIAALGVDLSPEDRYRLSDMLHPGRRDILVKNWVVPADLDNDWESFEHLLRLLSDFMHNGIFLRPSLHDGLDLLAEDAEQKISGLTANRLRRYLFTDHRFTGARTNYYALQNSDLSYTLDTGKGNPLTLCLIFQLVAARLDLEVSSCNYPGHFLSRVCISGRTHLVDCYNMGRLIPVDELQEENKDISAEAKYAIQTASSPRAILYRVLRNIERSFIEKKDLEDAVLMQKLQKSVSYPTPSTEGGK